MAGIKYLVYGDDRVQVSANEKTIKLKIRSANGDAAYTSDSKAEMISIIEELEDALHGIRWEIDSYNGVFKGMLKEKEANDEQVRAAGSD